MYLSKQRHNKQDVVDEVIRRCRLAKIDAPSANTIRNRIAALEPAHALRRRGFRDVARNRYEAIQGAFPGANHPLAVVQIDHTEADVILVDEVHRQPIGRPWVTLAIDVYSRIVAGIYVTFEKPAAISVGMCLAQAICPKREYLAELGVGGEWPVWGAMSGSIAITERNSGAKCSSGPARSTAWTCNGVRSRSRTLVATSSA